ncbi:MAG TPA: SDR family NAD(P)-dependent oxidoreductase, partial [Mycobacterium sp.]|nr:SDR family NAD(P)-dependent oxidoreductase [Mycobacterium sp.]
PLADFPNTVMNEVPLWLPYDPGARGPEAAPRSAPAQLLTEQWVRLSRRALVPPRAIGIVDHTGACAELAAALCAAATDIGGTARVIDTGSTTVDFDSCVILLPQSPGQDDAAAAAAVSAFFTDRRWWPGSAGPMTDCWLVTVAGEAVVAGDEPPDLVHAGISAGFRSIGAEHPGVRFRHLDLPGPAASAGTIISALHTADETELALRGGGLYAKRITTAANPTGTARPPTHVLILGGTGHLGLEFCEHFARGGAQRITLVSRSGETAAVADRLRRIRSAGAAQIDVHSCDVGDRAAVARLAEQCADAPADLIIQAALAYSDAELADITAEQADRVLRGKVAGSWEILRAFPRTENCRVVLCSSVAATIGGRGQIVYAAANRMLDAMAHRLRAEGLDCVAVQWGQWTVHFDLDPAGWARLAATGLLPMRPADAIAVGLAPLGGNAIVAGFDLASARPVLAAFGYGPLLSELAAPDAPAPVAAPIAEPDLEQRLMGLLAGAIGVDRVATIDTAVPMVAIGLDSLQALEFRRRVKSELNHDLDVADLLGGASIADVLVSVRSGR